MRRNVQYQYVMPYGRLPMIGGNVYLAGAKTVAKKAIPKLAKLWKSLPPDAKAAIISGGIELGSRAAIRAGDAIRSGVSNLSQKAEDKLAGLLGRKTSKTARKKVSKKARRMIKDLVKEKKRNVKLPSSFKNQLSASERSQVSKGGEQILSNLLYGRGLAIM